MRLGVATVAENNPGQEDTKPRNRKPLAINQAQYEIDQAEKDVKDKQKVYDNALGDNGEKTAASIAAEKDLNAAKDVLKEKQKALKKLQSGDTQEERREARENYMRDYYNKLGGAWIAALVKEDPELYALFQTAMRQEWQDEEFLNGANGKPGLYSTKWWKAHDDNPAWQNAFRMEHSADTTAWTHSLDLATDRIEKLALSMYDISFNEETLAGLAKRYMYEGWGELNDQGLKEYFAKYLRNQDRKGNELDLGGDYEKQATSFRDAAWNLGLSYDPSWYDRKASKVLDPKSGVTVDAVLQQMIDDAVSTYPVFKDKIGLDADGKVTGIRDVAGAYIARVKGLLELDENSVSMDDPLFKRAFNSITDEKGNPALMSLYDFEKSVREDPRWQRTKNAHSTYMDATQGLLRAMGFVG